MNRSSSSDSHSGDLLVEGARQHNLKNVSLRIPHNAVTVITGVSGSGKSSLAFDTLYAEGQWRYVESLSTYTRMFLERLERPDVDRLVNIRPAIAIEQKNSVRSSRSTVATATEIADLLRLLFAKVGRPICPDCRQEARSYHAGTVSEEVLARFPSGRAMVLFPIQRPAPGQDLAFVRSLLTRGFVRLRCGEEVLDLHPDTAIPPGSMNLDVVLDRLVLRPDNRQRLTEAVETAFLEGQGVCRVHVIGHGDEVFRTRFQCQQCGRTFEPLRPLLFSFNHPLGACPECKGFGNVLRYDEDLVIPDPRKSLADGAIEPWSKPGSDWWQQQMLRVLKRRKVNVTTPYAELSAEIRALVWNGDKSLEGIHDYFSYLEQKRYKLHVRVLLSRYRSPFPCPACGGSRLRPEALGVTVAETTIHQVFQCTVHEAMQWADTLKLPPFEARVAESLLVQLRAKLDFLLRVGLGYLSLDRQSRTLSGGEAQRITLANQLGSHLVGTLYVLDEPTIGLHARDTERLSRILHDLAAYGNTVVVVEHDRHVIESADHVVELGPGAGDRGGEVVCSEPKSAFLADPHSLTARYLRDETAIPIPSARRRGNGTSLILAGARAHNLKDLTVRFPLHMMICVTGVSGSGKSTLVEETLYRAAARAFRVESLPMGRFLAIKGLEHLSGVRLIDQAPIGRSPRSNPVTYLKAFNEIRQVFAALPEARRRGLTPASFSFNVPGGRCESCQGNGYEKLEMYFFDDLYVTCEHCQGRRFRDEILAVRYRDKSIHDILELTVDEARALFAGEAQGLASKLDFLASIGLGYLRLGQPATTLSGGEAQRLKIAAELKDRQGCDRLYILDEPTTGLHLDDIRKLLQVLGHLVDAGNTVVVVEHNLDVIKCADWILDLGPEGGDAGGHLIAEGRPEQVTEVAESWTGRALRPLLDNRESEFG